MCIKYLKDNVRCYFKDKDGCRVKEKEIIVIVKLIFGYDGFLNSDDLFFFELKFVDMDSFVKFLNF